MTTTKSAVLRGLARTLRDELDRLGVVTALARDEATSAESRPENKYDTRALEASYLAAGQGRRLAELRQLLGWVEQVDPVGVCTRAETGALLVLEDQDGSEREVFLAPVGGARVEVDGVTVQVVSPHAALGRAVAGLEVDDTAVLETPSGPRELVIVALC